MRLILGAKPCPGYKLLANNAKNKQGEVKFKRKCKSKFKYKCKYKPAHLSTSFEVTGRR